jgi:hypothetical protein
MSAYSEKIKREKEKGIFKVADFEGGETLTLIIEALLEDVTMYDRKQDLLFFRDSPKQLSVNVTNGDTLIKLFGEDPEDWKGHAVTLFLAEYMEGKFGIRVRAADATAGNDAPPKATDFKDEIPFE